VAFASFLSNIKGISTFTKYLFTVQAPLNASISKFWFVVNENNGSDQTVVDNNGTGYTIDQDMVLYDPVRTQHDEDFNYNFVVAVRHLVPLLMPAFLILSVYRFEMTVVTPPCPLIPG
ncbi:hypothetical protein H0H93_004226, partial [Arthromyces matolae]